VPDGYVPFDVEMIENWMITAAGEAAAADLPPNPDDVMFAPTKVTLLEKLEAARHLSMTRKIAGVLTFNHGRIRDRHVKFQGTGWRPLVGTVGRRDT